MALESTDEQLLARFAKGDTGALGDLASRHEALLFGLARGLLSGRDDLARDAVQDAWIRVIHSARYFQGQSSVRTWLYRIVVNRCHDVRTVMARTDIAALNGRVKSHTRPHEFEPPPAIHDDTLMQTLDRLPDSSRLILLLCHHRGLTNEQAADVLGIPVGTLKSRQHAAMQKLREMLATDGAQL